MFVVDASVTLAWCFEDEASSDADRALERLETEDAIAPAHWPLEVANGLRTAQRRGRLSSSDVPRLRALLTALPIQVTPVELSSALASVLEAASAYDLTAYDAAYLDLAAVRGLPLATADERLREACSQAGIALVT
jgi:predicted nucleic acid-binding protein